MKTENINVKGHITYLGKKIDSLDTYQTEKIKEEQENKKNEENII